MTRENAIKLLKENGFNADSGLITSVMMSSKKEALKKMKAWKKSVGKKKTEYQPTYEVEVSADQMLSQEFRNLLKEGE